MCSAYKFSFRHLLRDMLSRVVGMVFRSDRDRFHGDDVANYCEDVSVSHLLHFPVHRDSSFAQRYKPGPPHPHPSLSPGMNATCSAVAVPTAAEAPTPIAIRTAPAPSTRKVAPATAPTAAAIRW